MDLTQERLEQALGPWAPEVKFLEETDSTNTVAMRWAAEDAPEGAIVVANYQAAGRGRLGRSWFGKPGASIHLSIVLRPQIVFEQLGLLNLAAAIGVARTLKDLTIEARIKWPNDVLIEERKVSGILSEGKVKEGRAVAVILGVGINVNLEREDFPRDIALTATSLLAETGRKLDRLEILAGFLDHFGIIYSGLQLGDTHHILDAYRPLCATLGRRVRIEMKDRFVEAVAVDVDSTGALVLDSGEVVRVGDVIHLR